MVNIVVKYFMQFYSIFILLGSVYPLMHAEQLGLVPDAYNAQLYESETISPSTLVSLAEKYTPVPKELQKRLNTWLDTSAQEIRTGNSTIIIKNKDLLKKLIAMPQPLTNPQKQETDKKIIQRLASNQYPAYKSELNYIFVPFAGYVMRIAGPANRLTTLMAHYAHPYGHDAAQMRQNIDLLDEHIPTFHTISMYANYLLLKKCIKKHNIQYIKDVPTYLVHVPGMPTNCCDNNYVVIQEQIAEELTQLSSAQERFKDIPDQAFKELYELRFIGLWDIASNLLINGQNQFVILDLEQRNDNNPDNFFLEDNHIYTNCVACFIESLTKLFINICKHYPSKENYKKLQLWKNLMAKDTILNQQNNTYFADSIYNSFKQALHAVELTLQER
ncbi:MAG TPA: hypothetical protein PLU71_02185 [Candidatus Dependentiae bacterium]|nr:hypothetical protein [Candidatus Dependentiae bacterium]HRQ62639.1 hypothetical protein [Candidatus Dependentiae bacterium]